MTHARTPKRVGKTLLLALLALSACEVPSKKERQLLNSMIGHPAADVVRNFGVPTQQFEADNHLFLAYISQQTDYTMPMGGWGWGGGWGPGWGPGWGGGWGGPGWGWGGGVSTAYTYTCQTTFELVNGLVTGWTVRGDGC
ncbi:MAG: hypothetical protein LKJ54_05950 [Acetobacter peroxydans]|jgi:hypothetical protein|nr:hypothetical protein [Acetobacter peroxydans]MCI2077269.1 hypothetical protein [Acetobacter peroxydans]